MQQPMSLWGAQESKPGKIYLKIANELLVLQFSCLHIISLFFIGMNMCIMSYVIIGQQDEQYHSKFCPFKKHIKYKPPIRN